MTYEIDIQNDASFPVGESRLREAALAALSHEGAAEGSALTIVITTNEEVAALNRQYRGIDAPTDILSFPADEPPVVIPDEPPYLGDLIIAFPYASAQAEREGHVLDDSLALLVVHGCLHLLGYDHDTPEARAGMWAIQEAVLSALNIPAHYLPALEGGLDDDEIH
jgi:probable rRNA maturation factor